MYPLLTYVAEDCLLIHSATFFASSARIFYTWHFNSGKCK